MLSRRRYKSGGGFLLDTYSNSVAAFSLRKLKSTSVYACRIRRDSDNATTDVELYDSGSIDLSSTVSAGGTLGTWIGSNDGFIDTWYDQSGNSFNFSQATITNQPKIITSGVIHTENSLSALNYTSKILTYSGAISAVGDYSLFYVKNSGDTAFDSQTGRVLVDEGSGYYYDGTWRGSGFVNSGNQELRSLFLLSPTSGTAYQDGVLKASGLSYTQRALGGLSAIGARYNGPKTHVSYQEIIIFSGDKTSDRVAIEIDINNFYSIY